MAYEHRQVYIDGVWVDPTSTDVLEVFNPFTEQVLGIVPRCSDDDVDRAVAAARKAFPSWSATPVAERSECASKLAALLVERADELTNLLTSEVGMPINLTRVLQVGLPTVIATGVAKFVLELPWQETLGSSTVLREPAGVVAAISPWNYPLHQVVAKVVPALAVGCTVVLKPSEVSPLSAFALADLIELAGFPAGTFNLVSGTGPEVGAALATHPGVDMVSFTGSTVAGKRVSELAAPTVKRVALELGGKSANVVLPDADFARAIAKGVAVAFLNSGQTCTALTRLVVPEDRLRDVEEMVEAEVTRIVLGDPFAQGTHMGPVRSPVQRDRIRQYIAKGIDEGARCVTGGTEAPDDQPTGWFVRPTVLSGVERHHIVAQEEIFGPVLSILTYRTIDEAVEIANDSVYGLSGAVWSGDVDTAIAVAKRIRTGQISINGGVFNPYAPFGGFGHSGVGRELGPHGLLEFTELKALQL